MKIEHLDRLQIVHFPDPVLRAKCPPVEEFSDDIPRLAERMFELMEADRGVGLAAPQVGLSLRMFVCNPTGEDKDKMVCINPRFLSLSGAVDGSEGCLSIPQVSVTVRRAREAVIEAWDENGQHYEAEASDLLARIWQHEFDHLEGRLIIDRMSDSDAIANKKAIKALKDKWGRR